ncbi:hypothetical protein HPP92_014453 [Vanilla planifolia]|uniref:Uncharacterized protein n=1 Tax=Vanilla planifolia TaxID=51239 RepID=A0A835QTW8_VANPL|nr:hypothetical protein HPP92_014453 [Vanilla planifolia]
MNNSLLQDTSNTFVPHLLFSKYYFYLSCLQASDGFMLDKQLSAKDALAEACSGEEETNGGVEQLSASPLRLSPEDSTLLKFSMASIDSLRTRWLLSVGKMPKADVAELKGGETRAGLSSWMRLADAGKFGGEANGEPKMLQKLLLGEVRTCRSTCRICILAN